MDTSNLEKYKVDHLFLLVGENPMPNYVAARLLLNTGGIVYLVHSTATKPASEQLVKVLRSYEITSKSISLGHFEADADKILQSIQKEVSRLTGSIGLNYTGGTKTMAVHAYQALQDLTSPVYSYLDSRRLQLCIDRGATFPISLALSPAPTLEEILHLHNLTWDSDNLPIACPQLADAAAEFAGFFGDKEKANKWNDWCRKRLRVAKDDDGRWKSEAELQEIDPLILNRLPEDIIDTLQQFFPMLERKLDLRHILEHSNFAKLSHICHWLDNGWLEDYTLHYIQQISREFDIHESLMSIQIKDPRRSRIINQFEFDAAFLRGYQLFAISCTTSSKHSICKQKLFEAQLRARQLGGDEARVALVSCSDNPAWLKEEMRFFGDDQKIEVFGRSDLGPFAFQNKLRDWIRRNIGSP